MTIKSIFRQLLPVTLIFFCIPASAQQKDISDTIRQIDKIIEDTSTFAPGGAMTISRGGETIYDHAYGYADLEHNVPITTESIFEAGSVSKQFTAASILLLIKKGKLSLDDDVHQYLPGLPDYGSRITIRNLLTHTSGIKDWGSVEIIRGWPRTTRVYNQKIARRIIFRQNTLNFPPGTEYSYSNSNFTLLATIVERISKESLPEFTKKHLFNPIGMVHTQWRDNFRDIIKKRAIAYYYSSSQHKYFQDMPFENTYGHSALLTTTGDLIKWNQYWAKHGFGEGTSQIRTTQGVLKNGNQIEYACGALFISNLYGHKMISHSGATAGYRAWLAYFPDVDLSIAYLSNNGSSSVVRKGEKVAKIFLHKNKHATFTDTTQLAKNQIEKRTGIYKREDNSKVIQLELRKNKLAIKHGSSLKAVSKNEFYVGSSQLLFPTTDSLILKTKNGTSRYTKVRPFEPTIKDLKKFTGVFKSKECDATFHIILKEGKLEVLRDALSNLTLAPCYKDAFTASHSILITFIRDAHKRITGFYANRPRAEKIWFKRVSD